MKKFVIVTNFIFYYDFFSPLNCKEEMRNISQVFVREVFRAFGQFCPYCNRTNDIL